MELIFKCIYFLLIQLRNNSCNLHLARSLTFSKYCYILCYCSLRREDKWHLIISYVKNYLILGGSPTRSNNFLEISHKVTSSAVTQALTPAINGLHVPKLAYTSLVVPDMISSSCSVFSDIALIAWNRLWWEYLCCKISNRGNSQLLFLKSQFDFYQNTAASSKLNIL